MTAPLVPPEVDLQDFAFMPLDVRRLRDSDGAALESPEACWAALLLWSASWHQVPAASIPNDDRVLAQLAGYGRVVKEWQRVREGALRNFVLCDDDRWYHPVVAEKALEAWRSKQHHAYGKMADRVRKENKARASRNEVSLGIPSFEDWTSGVLPSEMPSSSAGIPPENALKGQGQGQGQGEEKKEEESKPKTKGVGRGTRLVVGWQPSAELRDWAESAHADVDLDRSIAEFVDFWIGVPGQRGTKLDWDATFRNAIRSDRAPRRNNANGRSGADGAWWLDNESAVRQGIRYGVQPRAGEALIAFANRVREAMRQ